MERNPEGPSQEEIDQRALADCMEQIAGLIQPDRVYYWSVLRPKVGTARKVFCVQGSYGVH